ncbi:DUF6059 family protein [Streptomyces capitiformicae]|nr:DUF6059 family protein [Streptomyces capitiformicae]
MSGTDKTFGELALVAAMRLLRPVGRALVAYGWLWLPGVPPREFLDHPWPAEYESPAAHPPPAEPEQVPLSRS